VRGLHSPHTNTHRHTSLSAMCSGWKARATKRSHPRTPARNSPNRTPITLPPLAPVKRGRGVGGEGATLPTHQHAPPHITVSNVLGLESPSYEENLPRTPVRNSPNRTPITLPPLAPVKRGRGVGGEGATLPTHQHAPPHITVSNVLGLESPSYEGKPPADSRPQLAKPNTEHRKLPPAFPFAASRLRVRPAVCKSPAPVPQSPDEQNATNARNSARAGKPELRKRGRFVPMSVANFGSASGNHCRTSPGISPNSRHSCEISPCPDLIAFMISRR
jgi:hypothetical protein